MKLKHLTPRKVFLQKSLISNRLNFNSGVKHINNQKTTFIDKNGISDPWKYSKIKKRIDYKKEKNNF